MSNVLVCGAHGNMGRRYSAIVEYLGHRVLAYDLGHDKSYLADQMGMADFVIVATPTDTHLDVIEKLPAKKIPLLCEKPPVKSLHELQLLKDKCLESGFEFWCVNQYAYLSPKFWETSGETSYDYWNSGKDGLCWDCFQLFAISNTPVILANKSPIWKCTINGKEIDGARMDRAYVQMVDGFIKGDGIRWGFEIVEHATKQILGMRYENHFNWNPSAK